MDSLYPHAQDGNIPQKRCTACEQFLLATTDFFHRARLGTYGLRSVCKECQKSGKRPVKPLDGYKRCTKCERTWPATLEFFHADKTCKSGLLAQCKNCRYERRPLVPLPVYVCKIHGEVEPYICRIRPRGKQRAAHLIRRVCPLCREISNQKHAPKHYENTRQWRQRNKDRMHGTRKKWAAKNLTKINDYKRKRRARKRAVPGTLTVQQIQQKLRAQRFRCYYCHDRFERRNGRYVYHLDHTIPLSRPEYGPRHDMSYTVLACPTCNLKKGNKLPHEWPEGGRLL